MGGWEGRGIIPIVHCTVASRDIVHLRFVILTIPSMA